MDLIATAAQSSLFLFIAAGLAVAGVGAFYAYLDKRSRRLRIERAKQLRVAIDPIAQLPEASRPTVSLPGAAEPAWFKACQHDLSMEDEEAARLQTRYHSCVARCIVVLSVGVLLMCVSVIVFRDSSVLKKFVTNFDLIATVYALVCFIAARVANRSFVAQRSLIETLRAWMHLALVFPVERPFASVPEAYPTEKANIATSLRKGSAGSRRSARGDDPREIHNEDEVPIYSRVEAYWTALQDKCRSIGLRQPSTPSDLSFYLQERPLEQFKYFVTAQWRIHEGQKWRESMIMVLYASSVILAVLKALNVFNSDFPPRLITSFEFATWVPLDLISTALLAVMVLSAAATNSLINRNERSLLHSYHAQERRIRKWLEVFAVTSSSADQKRLVDSILGFEDIMLNDLLDFIHITSRDVIEVPG